MNNILLYPAGLAIAGFTYEQITSYYDEKTNPPPGELIDVGGGYKLHIQCQGVKRSGVPAVIIETGIFDCSYSWQLVQPEIAQFTQVVTYDRAGYGWSEQGACPRTFEKIVQELKNLLTKKGVYPPFILVGHSLGGPIIRYYHCRYPEDVSGMIFVDAIHEEKPPQLSRTFMAAARALSYLSTVGIPRLIFKLLPSSSVNPQWTATMQKTYVACHQATRKAFYTCFDEADAIQHSFEELNQKKRSLNNLPIKVISSDPEKKMLPFMSKEDFDKSRLELNELNQKHLKESKNSHLIIAKNSGHMVQIDRPDIIINEIQKLVEDTSERENKSGQGRTYTINFLKTEFRGREYACKL